MPPSSKIALRYNFSDEYREEIFYFWYKNRNLGEKRFNLLVPKDETGQKTNYRSVQAWITEYGWYDRAADLDNQVIQRMDSQIIDERIEMFREHAAIGKEMKDFGLAYLRDKGVNSDMGALRAISEGIQIERSSRGLADSLARLAQMDDSTLLKEIDKLLSKDENTIDADVNDITPPNENSE